jgi:hypothetical protein
MNKTFRKFISRFCFEIQGDNDKRSIHKQKTMRISP